MGFLSFIWDLIVGFFGLIFGLIKAIFGLVFGAIGCTCGCLIPILILAVVVAPIALLVMLIV